MHDPTPLTGNLALLRQGLALLAQLPDSLYAGAAEGRSAVGAQYRHVLDHYHSFLNGLPNGLVDYDARARDPLVETSRDEASRVTREVQAALARLGAADLHRVLRVHISAAPSDGNGSAHGSTVGRELLFLLSHTVHHYAIMRLLLEDLGWTCDPDFGTAPSTLAYRAASG
ncbi:MAG TPA: DinB family protein [Gemmatimonadales bacterium]|jgi:uncharacterized damage-inducible protein DinB